MLTQFDGTEKTYVFTLATLEIYDETLQISFRRSDEINETFVYYFYSIAFLDDEDNIIAAVIGEFAISSSSSSSSCVPPVSSSSYSSLSNEWPICTCPPNPAEECTVDESTNSGFLLFSLPFLNYFSAIGVVATLMLTIILALVALV
jgi:hypothetical protein